MADPLARATIVPNYENKYLMASDGIRLSLNNFNNTYFVMLNINNYRFRHSAERKATGSTRKRIGLNVLGNLAIFTPTLKEQQKIGQFFNRLDDLITLHTKRLKLLKKKRKAYLQKLFPKNGKVIPRMRFKGFNDIWQSYKLSDLYTFKKGKNMSWNALNISGKYPAIIYPELYTKYSDNITKIFSRSDIEGTLGNKNDLLFPGSSTVTNGTAQANALMIDNVQIGGDIIIARPKAKIDSLFMAYQINSKKYKLYPIIVGTAVTHMYGKDLSKIKFDVPNDYKEQTKIKKFIIKIDKLITLESKK